MKSITSRTKFQVEMTYDGRVFRKIDPTGSWTTYPVEPMTLAQAEFVCADHNSRGTCSEFTIVDVEFESAQILAASAAKNAYLKSVGYDEMDRDERRNAKAIHAEAYAVFHGAKAQFLADYIRACYCV